MKTTTTLIRCSHCKGSGRVELDDKLLTTLNQVRSLKSTTAVALHAILGNKVGVTAINNRLEDLRKLKLVTRSKAKGKQWIYKSMKQ